MPASMTPGVGADARDDLDFLDEAPPAPSQAQILHALGCPLAQGYLFARPLSPQCLLEWLGGQQERAA